MELTLDETGHSSNDQPAGDRVWRRKTQSPAGLPLNRGQNMLQKMDSL